MLLKDSVRPDNWLGHEVSKTTEIYIQVTTRGFQIKSPLDIEIDFKFFLFFKMKRLVIFVTLIVTSLAIYAQSKQFIIRDSITHEVVPYAAVFFMQKTYGGTYTNENGLVLIPDSIHKIKISHISFCEKIISIDNLVNREILLNPNVKEIKEVVVTNKKYKSLEIGLHRLKRTGHSYGGATGFLVAIFIPYNEQWQISPLISEIHSVFKKTHLIEGPYKALLKIDLQLPSIKNGAPDGNSLLSKELIYKSDKFENNLRISLKQPVVFPKEGVFVILEWVSDQPGFIYLNPFITMTTENKTNYSWIKRKFKQEDWRKISEDEGEKHSNNILFDGQTPNFCIGLTILQ